MAAIDFILNLAALLLWLSWRSTAFDPLGATKAATLAGTLRRAEPKSFKGWPLAVSVFLLLAARVLFYLYIGSPAGWTPKLRLVFVVLPFRSDEALSLLAFSLLSFCRLMVIFYFWLLVLFLVNRATTEPDPFQKLIRLHLGAAARLPKPVLLMLPFIFVTLLWSATHPLLVSLNVLTRTHSAAHLLGQCLLLGTALVLSLKYVLPIFLFLHLLSTYVYLGNNAAWDFISGTARNLLAPLKRLPLQLSRVDLSPVAGVVVIFLLLHLVPRILQSQLQAHNLVLWPQ
jgi:uncharacterized protein YggT (Ycf19 family)